MGLSLKYAVNNKVLILLIFFRQFRNFLQENGKNV
jgi:hypothetical protein